jgi:hypothetical protein
VKRAHSRLTIAAAAAALLTLPLIAAAQPPATQPPPAQPPVAQQPPPTQPAPPAQPPAPPATPDPAAPPQTAQPPAPAPAATGADSAQTQSSSASANGGALMLLDRISDIVDESLGQKAASKTSDKGTQRAAGTTGVKVGKSGAGKVTIDRAALDEIKAEVDQLRVMLKDKQP